MDLKEKIAIIHNLMRVKKFTQAIINCHKLIKLHPDISYLYNLCGMAYQGNKQIKKSIESFNLALHYDPENLAAMNNLANSYKSLNHNDKAEELYERILKKDSSLINLTGIGCVTFAENIRNGNIYGNNVGLYLVNNPLSSIEIRDIRTFKQCYELLEGWNYE